MKKRTGKMSMQKRMLLSFSVPVMILQILFLTVTYPVILGRYKEKMQASLEQSVTQTVSFVDTYLWNMTYLAEMVENNGEVQAVMTQNQTLSDAELAKRPYREFWRLNKEFGNLENANSLYRFALYVPDAVFYSENHYFFYGESYLKERQDYTQMQETLMLGKDYLAVSYEHKQEDSQEDEPYLTLYHRIWNRIESHEIGVCSISISLREFQDVLKNTGVTHSGLVYLLNEEGKIMVDSNPKLAEELSGEPHFPGIGEVVDFEKEKIGDTFYYISRQAVGEEGWQMIAMVPQKEYAGQYHMILIQSIILEILVLSATAVIAGLLSRYYVGRLKKLRQEMTTLEKGNLNASLPVDEQGDEIEEVYRKFNYMVNEVHRLLQEHYRLGKNVKMAELKALQAQINPHFLYNTLDLINWIAMDYGASEIENIAWNLARYYRLSLNRGKSVISIGEEAEHTQIYVNIENYHFDQAITMHMEIPDELKEMACLNIILQPFVENAIVHGIATDASIQSCTISVKAEQQGGDVLFTIQDDGPGMTEQQMQDAVSMDLKDLEKGYGVKNINFRIKLCFGEKYGVAYESRPGAGTTVRIRIPALTVEEAMQLEI